MGVLLEVHGLQYSYGDRMAVKGVSFAINHGEIFGLLGPNGAGKTTTISCISGHLSRFQGNLTLMEKAFLPGKNATDRGLLGFVPQELAIYETLTGLENIILFAKLAGVPKNRIAETAQELLHFAGLESRKNDLVKQYSGGMKRRLNLVCGMVQKPRLVLMDERLLALIRRVEITCLIPLKTCVAKASRCSTQRTTWKRRNAFAIGLPS